ncbi:unnamed protein product [Ilex paraguariensis]|uniref:DELLA protein n=1 Tax=Ilex paraguariensis TaxID=185542 RepID=A0ABC8QSW8_9AQUA
MGTYDKSISSGSSSSSKPPDQIDSLLSGAGYKVRSSELRTVAQSLERLDNVLVNNYLEISHHLSNDAIHYNPSDLFSWVDSLLSEFNQPVPMPDQSTLSDPAYVNTLVVPTLDPTVNAGVWTEHHAAPQHGIQQQLTVVTAMEEDPGIQLVHVLMTCADTIQRGELSLAGTLIEKLQDLLTRVNTGFGMGKVAGYFIEALSRRLFSTLLYTNRSVYESEFLYHNFYEACPYLKFAHFTANQAILEAFDGHDCVHVIDFSFMQGLQWPALIQALALRSGGPPFLRLTGIGPPSSDGHDSLSEVGLRLAELARFMNVRFVFRGVVASRLDDIKPCELQVNPNEAVAINSIMQLHRLLNSNSTHNSSIDFVLAWIRNLNPIIMTVVEQEANHNQPEFFDRFTAALYYYSTLFDSLEACSAQPEKALAEMYIQRELCNVVCCEGSARVERHEPLATWRVRLSGAGFKPLQLGSNAFKQASMLLTLFSAEGYCVEENEGCLTLGWHNRPLIAASAWQAVAEPRPPLEH